jgi:hypothetical protein
VTKKTIFVFLIFFILINLEPFNTVSIEHQYKKDHPRLPHPSEEFINKLRTEPKHLKKYTDEANNFDFRRIRDWSVRALILSFLCTKEKNYLNKIKALADNPFEGHWFRRLEILAVAYDWTYPYLDEDARKAFVKRIEKEIDLSIGHYKEIRVSPFNDVGYSRLGAGIFMGAIAIYRESSRGRELFSVAHDILFNKYLPVWRQIMKGGGWHEGPEYMRLGVGSTIVSSLSSWGHATDRNLFKENPWLEDLIYYAIYTMRPDYQAEKLGDVAWGSGSWFPDLLPLSVIYDNPYGRWFHRKLKGGVFTGYEPSGWPWVEPDNPEAEALPPENLPLDHYFEGWGTVIMRSGWGEDNVFASFRAGDNFWSHQHFDSGSFTIYKRGALAIDSGTYSAGYDSEHHLKYQMQTIAHNCITVTDPKDYYPKAKTDLPNDGGQRRVGSGGYDRSPDDLIQWLSAKETYEMGDIVRASLHNDYDYILADTTAAYNNSNSGTGDFRSRTKRVRKSERHFAFIKPNIFLILDRVVGWDRGYKKKWLLHSINEPIIRGKWVEILRNDKVKHQYSWDRSLKHISSDKKYYQYGGKLLVQSLLPIDGNITAVGGPGHEFDVQGHNYDLDVKGRAIIPNPLTGPYEPGSWRLEVSPKQNREEDIFLHILYALDAKEENTWEARILDAGNDASILVTVDSHNLSKVVMMPKSKENYGLIDRIFLPNKDGKNIAYYLFGLVPDQYYGIQRSDGIMILGLDKFSDRNFKSNKEGIMIINLKN